MVVHTVKPDCPLKGSACSRQNGPNGGCTWWVGDADNGACAVILVPKLLNALLAALKSAGDGKAKGKKRGK